ncbi:MAG: peptidoglycan-associated lipoprotein Pal [Gammaproteobacteria bacterium]|nr:peptidoglycan-associated lipoprotein Pal [Gammaproteobacteria bacterium]MBU1414453.1 peptidoglycan-associated lipoprotein Pal [Gammaproteobacteria bacterium]
MRRTAIALTTAVSVVLMLSACSSQPPAQEQSPAAVSDGTPAPTPAPVTAQGVDPYSLAALKDPNSAVYKRSVFFDYDQYVIKDEFRSLIEAHGMFLVKNPNIKMRIQGNADERGSREYNLALGQKRAEAMKNALMLQGATEAQVEAVSLGEEKPRCTESNESCWSQNRRGDMLYTGEF